LEHEVRGFGVGEDGGCHGLIVRRRRRA
jgi:hypothetical protein